LAFLDKKDRRWFYAALSLGLLGQDVPELAEKSAGWVINGKAVGLDTLAERHVLARDSQDSRARKTLAQLREVRGELAALSLSAPGQLQQRTTRWEDLTERERALSRELGQVIGGSLGKGRWRELREVRTAIPEDAVLVEIARFDVADFGAEGTDWERKRPAHYVAWVIPARGAVRVVDLGEAEKIDGAVRDLRGEVQAFIDAVKKKTGPLVGLDDDEREKRFLRPLTELSRLVLQPLEIEPSRRWIISPDASLWLVPWAALPRKGRFAMEDHPISLLATSRDLILREAPVRPTEPVVFAGVDYGTLPVKNPPRLRFGSLPFSLAEAKQITPSLKKYAGVQPVVFTDEAATEKAFRNVRSPRVVVLSTHGFVRENAPDLSKNPLLQCGLAFAGANQRGRSGKGADEDGVLFGQETLEVDLRGTELVVLSACETAVSKDDPQSGEGVFSLRYAFQLAGARSVVATLWEVPDRPTAMITVEFFRQLAENPGDKAEALRRAQVKLLNERRKLGLSTHPFQWAALTLTGQ
jgi:CHAT domain-containing protein